MRGNKWTKEELEMLFTDMPNSIISQRIGKSVPAVRKMRYRWTGHYSEIRNGLSEEAIMKKYEHEARILDMAKDMRVKLLG